MQLTFPCPNCGKEFDLPWSMAGKKARCKRCEKEFVVPAPFEATSPRSSEAIPVTKGDDAPPSPPGPRPIRATEPPPAELLAQLRSGSVARTTKIEVPSKPAPEPPSARKPAAEPPARPTRPSDRPTPRSRGEEPPLSRGALAPKPPKAPKPAPPPARPAWLIPSIAAGGVALLIAINIGLFIAFVGFGKAAKEQPEREETTPPDLVGFGNLAGGSGKPAPAEAAEPSSPASPPIALPSPTTRKPAAPPKAAVATIRPEEEVPDRVMTTAEIVSRYEPSVALIKGKKGSGTGFVARPGIVATNSHVIDGERTKELEVRFPSAPEGKQGPYPAKLLYQDKDRDLALLAVASDLPPVRVAEGYKFRKGEDVTVIGNPGVGGKMILENAISRGIVSSMTKLDEHTFLQLGIAINPGNSGGPVFDSKGRVIGVVTLKTTRQEALAFAVPAEDLLSALETAGSVSVAEADAGIGTNPGTGGLRGSVPTLAYAFKPGQTYVYSLEVAIDVGDVRTVVSGNSVYRVKAVDADGITLAHKGWLTTTRKGKDGKVPPGGISGPKQVAEVELKIDDKGYVLNASGSSPLLLLGDFAMLMIEPLPDDPTSSWHDSQTLALREVEQVPGSVGPRLGRPGVVDLPRGPQSRLNSRSRPGFRIARPPAAAPRPVQPQVKVTLHEAKEETTYKLGTQVGDRAPIRKSYKLATTETVGDDPRLKMVGDGTLSFDVKAGLPVALEYKLDVVEVAGNATIRVPITVSCKLLEGQDREKGLRAPVYAPTAMNRVVNAEVSRLLGELKSPDNGRRREALHALFDAAPLENRRAEVSRALDRSAADKDDGVRGDAVKALGVWGDARSLDALIASLRDPSFGVRDELFEAIGRLSPAEKAAEAILACLATDQGRAAKALRAIGPPAEGPLLRALEEGIDPKIRLEACRLLKEVGTSQSLPALEKLAARKDDGEVARQAGEALKNIALRHPGDDEWAVLMQQGRSPDGGRRRELVERLAKIDPVEGRRAEVARALESLALDVDGRTQAMAIQALGSWGDERSRDVLIGRLDEPDLKPFREAIAALAGLGPDETAARAIARWIGRDRRVVIQALEKMGPVAEPALIAALEKAGGDPFARQELGKVLGRIGTRASVPVLRKLAAGAFQREALEILNDLEIRLDTRNLMDSVADLKGADNSRRMAALARLAGTPASTPGADRAEIARALDDLWKSDAPFPRKALREAVVAWGDGRSADALAEFLAGPDAKQWEEALPALVKLRPDARTAELLAARFTKDPRRVIELGREMPALFEVPLLAIVQGGEPRWRVEACKALGQLGTPASASPLQALAGHAGDDQIAREAEDAIKAIASRQ